MPEGLENDEIFKASYHYGPKEEQIKPENQVYSLLKNSMTLPLKPLVYPASSFLKDQFVDAERIATAVDQLKTIGGQEVTMKTPDGDNIHGFYLTAGEFKKRVEKYCDIIETPNADGTISQILVLKEDLCRLEEQTSRYDSADVFLYKQPKDKETENFILTLKHLGLESFSHEKLSTHEGKQVRGYKIDLGKIPADLPKFKQKKKAHTSHPTALIAPGSGMFVAAYKGVAASYLIRGIDVMMVDFRGYGESEGSPTDHKTKIDIETAYQYLHREHGVKPEHTLFVGHCLAGGAMADCAARHAGTNLLLDRSFATYGEAAKNKFPAISWIVQSTLPHIVNYDNIDNIRKVRGHIAINQDKQDEVIDAEQKVKQIEAAKSSRKEGEILQVIESDVGHTGSWMETESAQAYNEFLDKIGFRSRIFGVNID